MNTHNKGFYDTFSLRKKMEIINIFMTFQKKAFFDNGGNMAPKAIQQVLEDPKAIKAIAKVLEILGY